MTIEHLLKIHLAKFMTIIYHVNINIDISWSTTNILVKEKWSSGKFVIRQTDVFYLIGLCLWHIDYFSFMQRDYTNNE